jgi:hypothetical protein
MSVGTQVREAAARCGRAIRAASPTVILVVGFAVFLLYAFPGYMSNDSCDQLVEARRGVFSDAHPPVMAAEWRLLDMIVAGPILMLLVQGALFLGGLFGLLRQAFSPRPAAVLAVAVLLFPPVQTTMAVIWKDSQMAAFLLAGAAALLSPRRGVRLIGLALITLSCAFRHNAFGAAVPLVGLVFVWRPGLRWWNRYLISGAASVLSMMAALGLNRALTSHHVDAWDSVALADIAGVLNYTSDRSDTELREILRGVPLRETTDIQANTRAVFSPRNAMPLFYSARPLFAVPNPQDHAAILRAWRELVLGNWRDYLTYRTEGFRELLGLSDAGLWLAVWTGFLGYPELRKLVHHNAAAAGLQAVLGVKFSWLATETPVFRPYLYAILAIALLLACCRDRLTFAMLVSGLLYELSYFPAANTPDFRYSHWMIVCTCFATLTLFARRLRAGRAATPPAVEAAA